MTAEEYIKEKSYECHCNHLDDIAVSKEEAINAVKMAREEEREKLKVPGYIRMCDYEEGGNWALQHQWHDASNDLPYKDKTLVDGHTTRDLLCISDKNEAYIDFMELLKFGGKWHWFRKNIHKCKYWMPIPKIPEKLK